MRRITLWVMGTLSVLVLLFSYHTSTSSSMASTVPSAVANPASTGQTSTSGSGGTPGTGSTSSTSSSGSGSSSSSTSGSTSSATKTYTGDSVDTRWGPVQVKITVVNGKVTASESVVYPTENPRDQKINSVAIPTLNKEATAAGSAQIDMVSGATYTSAGYIQSLQSALDQANL